MINLDKSEIAVKNFFDGYNCCQSVTAAFCEDFGMSKEDCLKISEGFGGGMGRLRSVCGAVSGMFMLAGLKYSKAQPKDLDTRKLVYSLVQDMASDFTDEFGSIICKEILGNSLPADKGSTPTPRNSEFYKKRPCLKCIETAAKIAQKHLLDT